MDGRNIRFSYENGREWSIENQVRRCADHVRRLGGDANPGLVYCDAAISGSRGQR